MNYSIEYQDAIIQWEPTRSTPSCKVPIKELGDIINKLKKHNILNLVDLGSGNGRNSKLLKHHFQLTLVECGRNIETLKKDNEFKQCKIESFEKFITKSNDRNFDAFFISFVFHTIPHESMRNNLMHIAYKNLTVDGILCIVSPRNDSKYTSNKVNNYMKLNGGIIKTYPDKKFTYYENLSQKAIIELANKNGFYLRDKISSKSKNILFFKSSTL